MSVLDRPPIQFQASAKLPRRMLEELLHAMTSVDDVIHNLLTRNMPRRQRALTARCNRHRRSTNERLNERVLNNTFPSAQRMFLGEQN